MVAANLFQSSVEKTISIKIVSWNVNSIRARLTQALDYLRESNPDIVLLQELKCQEEQFPSEILDLGYNAAIFGQKTYNGVAILSKYPLEDVQKGLPSFQDESARYIEAVTKNIRVGCVYVPNGQEVGSEKYAYKLQFLESLKQRMQTLLSYDEAIVIGGDYNIAPFDVDVHDPQEWEEKVLFSLKERQALWSLYHLGYGDAFRLKHKDVKQFSWWDYRAGAFEKDRGLRIDHLLLSPQASDLLENANIDKWTRDVVSASDHAPTWCCLAQR